MHTGSDHVAKFRGDRPRELGDYALKKKEKRNITSKIEDLPFYRTGGLKSKSKSTMIIASQISLVPWHYVRDSGLSQ